jgi:hypothetical protein
MDKCTKTVHTRALHKRQSRILPFHSDFFQIAGHIVSLFHLCYGWDWGVTGAGIFEKSMGARNRGGIGLSYRSARLPRLVEFIPWNQFQGPINI